MDPPPGSGDEARAAEAARELLEELRAAVPPGDDGMGEELNRFEGALLALTAVGAADWDEWAFDDPAEPELDTGAGGEDLVAVLPGPSGEVDGVRVLYVLRFADGITLVVRRAGGDDAELRDDAGTEYWESSGGGGGGEEWIGFRPGPPAGARWVELTDVASRPIRMSL